MLSLRKFCFVPFTQRCFKSEELPPDLTINTTAITQTKSPLQGFDKSPSVLLFSDPLPMQRLLLTVSEAQSMPIGQVLEIQPEGLVGSSRRDGRTYAGYDQSYCDILLPKDEFGIGSVHFVVEYNTVTSRYMIKDEGDGTGTFVKLIEPLPLQSYYILSFGSTHMTVILEQTEADSKLTIKFIEGPKAGQSYVYSNKKEVIRIGRMQDCSIKFDDTSLSRYQCCISYVNGTGWTVSDGDGNKPSTNGTWLFLDDYYAIETGMIFKAGMTLFKVRDIQATIEEAQQMGEVRLSI
jgi:hypothetical protein